YTVLRMPGLRLGRTDPALDPKGVNTLFALRLAERYYAQPGLARAILGTDTNPAQIFPEEDLVARLSSGQLDAGFFYLNEVRDAGLPSVSLPTQINLSDATQSAYYAQATYSTPQGKTLTGAPILYSLTIPATVKNEAGAEAFVRYLLGSQGQRLLRNAGVLAAPYTLTGAATVVPAGLRDLIK
ncbi:MAG: extracellular solute-binding protein, partial [Ktedonobacterales bacterium]|nr:extracellular solute-binding protein [Ktedonobacterales bacterium]